MVTRVARTDASRTLGPALTNRLDGTRFQVDWVPTTGSTNADLEVGDWIELESASFDPHIKAFGTSWSGKQLLITELRQTADSTKITAIELY